jgi:hypothetical protein
MGQKETESFCGGCCCQWLSRGSHEEVRGKREVGGAHRRSAHVGDLVFQLAGVLPHLARSRRA